MALTETASPETRPDSDPSGADPTDSEQSSGLVSATTAAPANSIDAVLGSGDHKTIGRLWIGFGSLFLTAGIVMSLVAQLELVDLDSFAIAKDQDQLTQIWSIGRDLTLFGGIVPILVGIATFLVPLQVGAASIAFARGAAAAFWSWLVGSGILILSYIMNGGPGGGRFDYVILWILALGVVVVSLLWALICVATTVLGARATGMSLEDVPATTWGFFVFAIGSLLALPVLLAELVLAYLDTKYGFLPTQADRTVLVSIANSVNLVPAIYWIAVPALGMLVDVISVHTKRTARSHKVILAVLALYGFVAYGAEMLSFAWRGRPIAFDNALLVAATLFAVVPVILVLALAGPSLGKGRAKLTTPLVAALASGLLLLAGSLAALLGLVDPFLGFIEELSGDRIDYSFDLFGTSFHEGIRALVLGSVILAIISGIHHWAIKIFGRSLDNRVGLLATIAVAGGAVLWGAANIVAAFLDQPALPELDSAPQSGVEILNVLSVIGAGLMAIAVGLLLLNLLAAVAGRVGSSAEPWRGLTLEWATASPPIAGNFEEPPIVSSPTPLAGNSEAQL